NPAATTPVQAAPSPTESVMSLSAANLDMGFAEQKTSSNSDVMKAAQGALPPDETKPGQGTPPQDESVMSPSAARPERSLAAQKGSATPVPMNPGQAGRAPSESVMPASGRDQLRLTPRVRRIHRKPVRAASQGVEFASYRLMRAAT